METYNKNFEVKKIKGFKKRFGFYENEREIAALDFPSRWKKEAVIMAGTKLYKIARKGFWKSRLEIQSDQSPYTKWSLPINWKGYLSIRFDDNRQYHLKKKGFWKCSWHWFDEQEQSLVEMKSSAFSFQKKGNIGTTLSNTDTILFLSAIGWFILICTEEDAAVAAAVS